MTQEEQREEQSLLKCRHNQSNHTNHQAEASLEEKLKSGAERSRASFAFTKGKEALLNHQQGSLRSHHLSEAEQKKNLEDSSL